MHLTECRSEDSQADTVDASLVSFYRNVAAGNTAFADLDALTAALEMTGGAAADALVAWGTFEIAGEVYEQAVGR